MTGIVHRALKGIILIQSHLPRGGMYYYHQPFPEADTSLEQLGHLPQITKPICWWILHWDPSSQNVLCLLGLEVQAEF